MKLRPLTDADWDRFVQFGERYFGVSHNRDLAFNRHWFKPPGWDGWAGMVLEGDGGRIAGVMMFIVVPGWFEGEVTRLGWISTGVTDEAARATGAGAQLYLWGYRAFPLVGAMSGNALSNPINSRMGVAVEGAIMRRFVRLLRPEAANLCSPADRDSMAKHPIAALEPVPLTVSKVETVPEDFTPLWHRMRAGLAVATERSPEFLRWRYLDTPYSPYGMMTVRDDAGDLVALAVQRMQATPAGPVCRIVDFVGEPGKSALAWKALAAHGADQGAVLCDFFVIGRCLDSDLAAGGFLPADPSTGLDVIPHLLSPVEHRAWTNTFFLGGRLAKGSESWRRPEAIYFTKGDSDRDWLTAWDMEQLASCV